MSLTNVQKQFFYENGYVHVPGVIPPVMVNAALQSINHSMGEGIDPAQLTTFRSQSYAPEYMHSPVIMDLLNKTPALGLAESMIGEGRTKPVDSGQIALRFPQFADPPPPPHPHIDGMYTPYNGVTKGEIWNFTALVGIFLSDVHQPYAGNFTVWPGTHRQNEQYFREHGPDSLLNGMPKVTMPEPVQTMGVAGDIVICHYMLAHTAAINVSPHTRYAIFFRLHHVEHDLNKWESMTDIWLQWEGMREIVANKQETDVIK